MARRSSSDSYLDGLTQALRHANRVAGIRGHCTGFMLPRERKIVEPLIAGGIDPSQERARHQALRHFVAKTD